MMKFVKTLNKAEVTTLKELYKNYLHHRVRVRANAIYLSHKGYTVDQISHIIEINRDRVSKWMDNWESKGLIGIFERDKSGRPPKLTDSEREVVLELVEADPKSIKNTIAKVDEKFNKKVSGQTIKRIIKKSKLIWKRVRTSLKSKRDPVKFAQSKTEISVLASRQERGEIDLYYGDEVGFNLIPKIPYAWQRIGENIELTSSRSKSFNVLGLLQKNGEFESIVFDQSINSNAVVGYFDLLAGQICKETWIILDNSPIHKSDYFMEQIPLWKEKGLNIYFLPPYCPELNLIEILWRFIKYYWMPIDSYLSIANLEKALLHILANVGNIYNITFE
jgi:transposase